MIRFSALLFALLATCVSFAQSPYLVKDINTRTGGRSSSSNPSGFVADGGAVYFAAADHTGGTPVLWKVANGQLVKLENSQWHPLQPRNILPKGDGTCFFTAKNGSSPGGTGFELWRTDGTPEGTILLKDINPGSGQSAPENFLLKQGLLYFTADHPTYGRDIWVSDGTAAGTRLLKDFPLSSTIFPVGVVGNQVAILTGSALWLTDGTEAGTTMVKQWTYTWRSAHVVGSKIFVVANDGISGDELWVSDGTTAGTQRVTNFVQTSSPPFGDSQSTLIPLPNGVLFHADNGAGQAGLWFSDGTIAGTILVLNTSPPWMHSVVAGIAYFNTDVDLYRTNGTIAGTYRIDKAASHMPLPAFGAAYYVIANDNGTSAMRRTDGTIAGTSTTMTFPFDQDVYSMTATGGKLYFSYYTSLYGAEPFVSHDGASIEMLVNLAHDQMPSSSPRLLTGTAAGVFFFTTDGYLNVWFSDGTEGGTIPLGLPVPSNVRTSLSRVGSSVFIQVSNSWWKSDGTVAGTTPISFFPPDSTEVILNQFAASDRFYLATGTGIYVSDGTTTTQILPGGTYGFAAPDHFVEYAGRVYFQTYDSLWETRGTIETTRLISRRPGEFAGGAFYNSQQVDPVTGKRVLIRFDPAGAAVTLGTFSSPRSFEAAGRYVYFEDWSFETSTLWRTDGTAGGTIQLAQLSKAEPTLLVASGPYLYFWGFDSTHGGELWRTDGTLSGTVLVKDIAPGSSSSQPESLVRSLTDVRGNLWFTATDGLYYNELWRTDGTEAGTVKVANFGPTQLTVAGSHLFFAANDTATGEEPWAVELDGSALSIADTRVAEGNIGTTAMRFTVTREGDLSQSASATYTTESGSADETDYVAASGTVSFAVGQATATIDVSINGDTEPESTEALYVVLSSPVGTTLATPRAAGLIEDDDRRVDLSVAFEPSIYGYGLMLRVTNKGSVNATGVQVRSTHSPSNVPFRRLSIALIAPGESELVALENAEAVSPTSDGGTYLRDLDSIAGYTVTATVTANEQELQPADNTASTMSDELGVVVFPPFQETGSTKTGSAWSGSTFSGDALLSITSGTQVSGQPTPLTLVAGNVPGWAVVTGYGRTVFQYPIVNLGQTPKLATAASLVTASGKYGAPIPVKLYIRGARPDGVLPTGLVTIKAYGGGVVTQLPLQPDGSISFSRSNLSVGSWPHWVEYAGDANFQPMRAQFSVVVSPGSTSVTGTLMRTSCYIAEGKLIVKAAGGAEQAPTGSISVSIAGGQDVSFVLTPTGNPGEASAMVRVRLPSNNTTLNISYWPQQFSLYESSSTNQTITFADCAGVATALYVMTPCRIIDTRDSTMLANYATRFVQAAGRCGIPADARAISGNVTAVSPAADGFLRMLPSGVLPIPNVSTMSYRRGKTRANNTIILLNSDGALDAYNGGPNPLHFIIDVYAYFK